MHPTSDALAQRRALWQLHSCVLLWGFTAILGKLITLPTSALVVWRMGLAARRRLEERFTYEQFRTALFALLDSDAAAKTGATA